MGRKQVKTDGCVPAGTKYHHKTFAFHLYLVPKETSNQNFNQSLNHEDKI